MFWKKCFFGYNHEISHWILAPFLSEAVEASRCNSFLKLVDETQMYKPLEATRHYKKIPLLILLPLRADLLCILHYETPCTWKGYITYTTSDDQPLLHHWHYWSLFFTVKSQALGWSTIQFLSIFGVLVTQMCFELFWVVTKGQ